MPVAHLVVDRRGDLIMANELARPVFGIDARDVGRPLRDLEVSYRPVELRSLIEQAQNERRRVTLANIERHLPQGGTQHLDVHVTPLQDNGSRWLGAGIVFEDVTRCHDLEEDLERSRHDLETAYEELQSANEELETTNEELQSSNEELQTTNEELQSTNEEMETMNEELQSSNEELQTMNEEMRQRSIELNRTNTFLQSILAGLDAGVVVVGRDFKVLLWNSRAEDLWGLRANEIQGRSLFALDIGLPVDKLREPLRNFLVGTGDSQEILLGAVNRRGREVRCRITYNALRPAAGGEPQGIVLRVEADKHEPGD